MAHPSTAQITPADPHDKRIEDIRRNVTKIVAAADYGGTLDNPRLLNCVSLLFKRRVHLLNGGNHRQFRVCSKCSGHDVINAQTSNIALCRVCQVKTNKRKQNENRRGANKAIRVDPKRTVPLTSLKPDELKERGRRARNDRKVIADKIKRTTKKQIKAEVQAKLLDDLLK